MSTLKQVILSDKDQDVDNNLDWSYIIRLENGVVPAGVANAETQTDQWSTTAHKQTQTSNPVIMHIDLTRTHSKRRHTSLVDVDGLVGPQFDRQAPGRISTSPTLRRMRSTRRPQMDFRDPAKMESTLEEPGSGDLPALTSPLSPAHRQKSPLAASPLSVSDGEIQHVKHHNSSSVRQRSRSHRSKTFDNGIASTRPASLCVLQSAANDFEFPDTSEVQENIHRPERLQERRRSSVVVSLPGLDSPGDLFVSNGVADMLNGSHNSDTKKSKWPFSRRSTTKGKTSTSMSPDIEKYLSTAQITDWRETHFQKYKDWTLADFLRDQSSQYEMDSEPQDYKRQEAVWELLTSECVYFLDQLMVLKEVFLATLSNLQTRNCLTDVDSWRLFANLNELCLVSFGFLNNLLQVIKSTLEGGGPTLLEQLSKAFHESVCYCLQKYCLNYSAALVYLDSLKPREDFSSYVKVLSNDSPLHRLFCVSKYEGLQCALTTGQAAQPGGQE